jgi:hypothetical protein
VVELLGQVGLVGAQVVDHLAHGPVLGRVHDLALHQAPGGFLRIGQRLLHRRPVPVVEPLEDRGGLLVLEVLEDVDEVVGIELAHRLHDLLGRQELDDLLAQAPVELRQDLAVDPPRPERQPRRPLTGGDLLQKVGDIGGVQRLHQRVDKRHVPRLDRVAKLPPQRVVERIGVASVLGGLRAFLQLLIAHFCLSLPSNGPLRGGRDLPRAMG